MGWRPLPVKAPPWARPVAVRAAAGASGVTSSACAGGVRPRIVDPPDPYGPWAPSQETQRQRQSHEIPYQKRGRPPRRAGLGCVDVVLDPLVADHERGGDVRVAPPGQPGLSIQSDASAHRRCAPSAMLSGTRAEVRPQVLPIWRPKSRCRLPAPPPPLPKVVFHLRLAHPN